MTLEPIDLNRDADDARVRVATLHGGSAKWLYEVRHLQLESARPCESRTDPATESFLLVLSGTHDLYAGGGNWVRRGLRKAAWDGGRPVGIFLPPNTPYRLENGTGSAIVLTARQPQLEQPDTPKQSLSKKPLLQMAGSGKAFDPATGTWKPKEAFLESPEAILPRRILSIDVGPGGATGQRILDHDYKSLGLCVDEVVLGDGQTADLPAHTGSQDAREIVVYFECEDSIACGDGFRASGSGVFHATGQLPRLTAVGGRAYAAIAYAGPKSA